MLNGGFELVLPMETALLREGHMGEEKFRWFSMDTNILCKGASVCTPGRKRTPLPIQDNLQHIMRNNMLFALHGFHLGCWRVVLITVSSVQDGRRNIGEDSAALEEGGCHGDEDEIEGRL